MIDSIKYAQQQVDKYKGMMADCHESMSNFYYQKALDWERHLADLKKEDEQKRVAC